MFYCFKLYPHYNIQGDSGGPFTVPGNAAESFMYLVGLVSFGHKCAEPGIPGVYVRVSGEYHWSLYYMQVF